MSTYLILKDELNQLWKVGVQDNGQLTSELAASGTPMSPIIKDYQGGLTAWQWGILSTSQLTTTNVGLQPSLTYGIPLLSHPSNILWSLVVSASGQFTTFLSNAPTAAFITALTQSLLNDKVGDYWTFDLLLPFLQLAFDDLSQELELNEIPITKEITAVLNLAPLTQVIGFGTMPALPENFIAPISIDERLAGQPNSEWSPMDEVQMPPADIPSTYLNCWWWDGIQINFLGSTSTEDIRLRFTGGLYKPQSQESVVGIRGVENYLAEQTAYYAADSIGNQYTADRSKLKAGIFLEKFIRFQVKNKQGLPVRKLGYRRRAKGFSFR